MADSFRATTDMVCVLSRAKILFGACRLLHTDHIVEQFVHAKTSPLPNIVADKLAGARIDPEH